MSERSVEPEKARAIVEAVLLTADVPVTPGRLVSLIGKGYNGRDIREAIDALNERYEGGGHGFSIIEVAGGFQLATRQEYGPWLRKFHNDPNQIRLSPAALEVLAIVAFKQPVTRIEVDNIRGVNSGGVLHTLMELSMVRIVGRSEGIGKPMLLGTTREFLVHFGLKTLVDLPKPKELEELLAAGANKAEARQQMAMELQGLQGGTDGEGGEEGVDGEEVAEEVGGEGEMVEGAGEKEAEIEEAGEEEAVEGTGEEEAEIEEAGGEEAEDLVDEGHVGPDSAEDDDTI